MAWGFYLWGAMDLLVAKGSYDPPTGVVQITEIPLIPTVDNVEPSSIIQQGGRLRERINFQGYATEADYKSLETDKYSATERTFTDIDGNTFNVIIESLNSRWINGPYPYFYSITFLEV